jgi:hypothetical protein
VTPAGELTALGAFYGIDVAGVLARDSAALQRYAEWVLGRDAFAVVTLGPRAELGSPRFRAAAARWPGAITGVKRELGAAIEPTYYVRTLCPWGEGVAWLGPAAARIPPARTLYGLGFQGDVVKTYALSDDGFVSYRLAGDEVLAEPKEYRADVAWDAISWPDPRWAAIGELGCTLGFRSAGHVGHHHGAMKVYVERTGAIATDRSFA